MADDFIASFIAVVLLATFEAAVVLANFMVVDFMTVAAQNWSLEPQ